eukprot:Skav228194  [mRNA]  locus=scaffold704:79452:81469:- [translate_table: standard]
MLGPPRYGNRVWSELTGVQARLAVRRGDDWLKLVVAVVKLVVIPPSKFPGKAEIRSEGHVHGAWTAAPGYSWQAQNALPQILGTGESFWDYVLLSEQKVGGVD